MNSLKIFLKVFWQRACDQWLLYLVAALSLWFSIQTSIPSLYLCSPWEEQTAKGITTIVQGLSFSFFAAWLFYIFQDVVPQVQKRIDAIRVYNDTIRTIREQLKRIEACAFANVGSVPPQYDADDLYSATIDKFINPADDKLKDWGLPDQIPLFVNLKLSFTLVAQGSVKSITSILQNLARYDSSLNETEKAKIDTIRVSKFIAFFDIEHKGQFVINVSDKKEILPIFNDFIYLRRTV